MTITVVCGSMFAGKSEELLRRVRRSTIAGRAVQVFKPAIDDRYDASKVVTHIGDAVHATAIPNALDVMPQLRADTRLVAIDEAQFFDESIVILTRALLSQNHRDLVIAGLDQDFRGEPFGHMPELLAMADEVVKLRAICTGCGELASYTYREIDGKPAHYDSPTVLVGGRDRYSALCRTCYNTAYNTTF